MWEARKTRQTSKPEMRQWRRVEVIRDETPRTEPRDQYNGIPLGVESYVRHLFRTGRN